MLALSLAVHFWPHTQTHVQEVLAGPIDEEEEGKEQM